MNSINVIDLFNQQNPNIIDIRNNYYYNIGHIKGAINIPYYDLLTNYRYYLNKYTTYYLYCDEGEQSIEIANRLNSFGYNTISISGGYIEYQKLFH